MKVAIVGSREFPDLEKVRAYVRGLNWTTIVISGGARGVDRAAIHEAKKRGLGHKEFLIDKSDLPPYARLNRFEFAKRAYERNQRIVDAADRLVAFWDGKSGGTQDSIGRARAKGIPVEVIGP